MIYAQLFFSFLQVGLFSIGGGYAAIPLIQSQAVNKYAWLSLSEFTDLVTIAEMTPGPIALNAATFVGIRTAGLPGALIATAGNIIPSCVIVALLAFLYNRYKKLTVIQSVLASLRPAVVAMIASAGLNILMNAVFASTELNILHLLKSTDILAAVLFAAALILIRKAKLNPILTMVICGAGYLGGTLALRAFGIA